MKYLEHYSYRNLLKTSLPVAAMLLFTSIYAMVDGFFVSNFVGKNGFTAVNLMMPYLMFFGGIGFIFGSGGSALIGKTLGEKKVDRANQIFTTLVCTAFVSGAAVAGIGIFCLPQAAEFFGAEGEILKLSVDYGRIFLLGTPFFIVQLMFESLYSTAGKHILGLYSTIICGVMNIVLDAVFIGVLGWGIKGAAVATITSQMVGAIIPILFFGRKNNSCLEIVRCRLDFSCMKKVASNGMSEMVNNVTLSIVSMVYNIQLLKYGGNDAVSAYGVMMYAGFFFNAILYGFITGISPLISYHYGAENSGELRSLLKKSVVILMTESAIMYGFSNIFSPYICGYFVGYDAGLLRLTLHGFRLFSFWFLVNGLGVFGSCFFTALNNGKVSATLSFARVMLFQLPCGLLLPVWYGLDGIFISAFVAEVLTVLLSLLFVWRYRNKYHYASGAETLRS